MSTATELKTDKKFWTDEEFMALPKDRHRYEIVNGELVDMGNSGALHGYVCSLHVWDSGSAWNEAIRTLHETILARSGCN